MLCLSVSGRWGAMLTQITAKKRLVTVVLTFFQEVPESKDMESLFMSICFGFKYPEIYILDVTSSAVTMRREKVIEKCCRYYARA